MHMRFLLALGFLAVSSGLVFAQQSVDLSQHVFFKHIVGKWEAVGDLKAADGHVVKVKEEWTGKATSEGEFVIEGKRQIDESQQTFRWSITRNAAAGNFAGVLTMDGNAAEALQFEMNVSEVNLTADLKAPIGANGSLTLIESFAAEDKNSIKIEVTLVGDGGETNLAGTVIHKRVKE